MNLPRLLLSVIMFSASARAFSLASTRPALRLPCLVARMSSAGEPDTTIVAVCKRKIEDALGPDKVEVTGALKVEEASKYCIVSLPYSLTNLAFRHVRRLRRPEWLSHFSLCSIRQVCRQKSRAEAANGLQSALGRIARPGSCS